MKKVLVFLLCATILCFAGTAMATSFYYEATDVTGVGTITYGINGGIDDAPVFTFKEESGSYSGNLDDFVAGDYTVSVFLKDFGADINEDGVLDGHDFYLPEFTFTSGPYTILSLPPLTGTYGQLSWSYQNGTTTISYDFGSTGTYTNSSVNQTLAGIDLYYSNQANGVMDANISWGKLRVEFNSAPVPEPTTILLSGFGLLGMGIYLRRRRSKK